VVRRRGRVAVATQPMSPKGGPKGRRARSGEGRPDFFKVLLTQGTRDVRLAWPGSGREGADLLEFGAGATVGWDSERST